MKVAPSFETTAPPRRAVTRDSGGGFAQLLEGGAQARTVLSQRALGFGEAGLLGVHFAHGPRATPHQAPPRPSPASFSPANSSAADTPLAGTPQPGSVAPQAARPAPEFRVSAPQATGATPPPPPRPPSPPAEPAIADRHASSRTATDAGADETPLTPGRAPVRPTSPSPTRRRAPFLVRLLGDGAELVVVIVGSRPGDESISELEATARALASEYCMGISHLFVTPSRTTTAG